MTEKPKLLEACGLERIQALMGEVVRKTSESEGACVYRGEPECYPVVSSGLYRKCLDSTNEAFAIARVEQDMTDNARQYTTLTNDDEILAEIQHFGGSTNLIDFTDDYLIALFFASLGSDGKDGRVVLHWSDQDTVIRPKQTINRVVFQKSVFVRPQRGFIVPDPQDEIVVVPGDLKAGILSFLQRFHGISEGAVFNDIHGFIRHQTPDHSLYVGEFRKSLERPPRDTSQDLKFCLAIGKKIIANLENDRHAFHQIGMVYENQKKSRLLINPLTGPLGSRYFYFAPDELIKLFTHLIDNKQSAMRAEQCIFWRGEAYLYLGETELAMRDFEEALAGNSRMAEAYHGRGNAFRQQSATDRAMADALAALLVGKRIDRWEDSSIVVFERELGAVIRRVEDTVLSLAAATDGACNQSIVDIATSRMQASLRAITNLAGPEQARIIVARTLEQLTKELSTNGAPARSARSAR